MRNTIRCCISCILPCGALDVVRIVHASGRVEEISGSVKAADIMKMHPKHVLKKPTTSSPSSDGIDQGSCCPKIVVVPPDAELKRGKIYFLMPVPVQEKTGSRSSAKRKKRESGNSRAHAAKSGSSDCKENLLVSDRYLTEILSEKVSTQRERRRGRVGVWRPHLESICETPLEA